MYLNHDWPLYPGEPNTVNPLDYGTAFGAALQGKATTLQSYCDNGGNADVAFIPRGNRQTCLTMLNATVQRGHALCTKTLLDNKASTEIPDQYGCTPVHWAVIFDRQMCLYWLMQAKANLTKAVGSWQLTPLHLASLMGKTSIIKMLINAGVDCNTKTAAIMQPNTIRLLISVGVSPKALAKGGLTAYDLALSNEAKGVFEKNSQPIVNELDTYDFPGDLALIVCDYINGNGSDNHQPLKPTIFDQTTTSTADCMMANKIANTILWTALADGKEPAWYTALANDKKPTTRMEGVLKVVNAADWEQKTPAHP
jgi:hypothetical protein